MDAVTGRAPVSPIFREPSVRTEQVSQLVLGESAVVMERREEWCRIETAFDHYPGWIHGGYLIPTPDGWDARATGWSEGAGLEVDGLRQPVPLRARLAPTGDGWELPDGRTGRCVDGSVVTMEEARTRARGLTPESWAARHFLGSPYQWGGLTPWGVDCSGLVQSTYAARGIAMPRDSSQQVTAGEPVPMEAIRPGDLLFFNGDAGRITHVAFAGLDGTLVHSTISCGGCVQESWLPGTRAAALRERLVAVRRVA